MVENGFNKRGACYVTDCIDPNCNHIRSNEDIEAQPQADNTGSPKLLDELRSLVTYGCEWDSPPVRKRAFDIIEQLRAGA